jgi:hypothetical protein
MLRPRLRGDKLCPRYAYCYCCGMQALFDRMKDALAADDLFWRVSCFFNTRSPLPTP